MAKNKAHKKQSFFEWCRGYTGQKYIITVLFLLVPLALLITFTFVPAANMFVYSFQSRDQFGINPEWVGFDNYKTVFTDSDYLSTFKNSLYYLFGSFIQLGLALIIAEILCSKIKFKNFYKATVFFPWMMNGVAVALIFRSFFMKGDGITNTDGALNSIITFFGGNAVSWLSDPKIVNFCLVFASIWRYIGFDIVMFIGAIQSINPDIYEAAELDGANAWQRFWYIIFPGIKPVIGLQMILAIKGAMSVFEIPYVITNGQFGTTTFVIKTIETAFGYKKVGLASAMAVVLLIIIIIVTIVQKLLFNEEADNASMKSEKLFKKKKELI
jgi:ABC-type sugar transport system permease subunit